MTKIPVDSEQCLRMTEAGQSLRPEAPGSPRVSPSNRPAADDRLESGALVPPPTRPRPAPVRPAPTSTGTGTGKGMTFTLQKSTFAGLIGGLLMLGVLIFIGGFLAGARFILGTQPARMESLSSPATMPADTVTPVLPAGGPAPKEVNTLTNLPEKLAAGTAPEPQSAAKSATAPALSPLAPTSPAPSKAGAAPPFQQPLPQTGPDAPPPAAETADNLAIDPPVPVLLQPALKAGDKPTLAPASVTVRVNPLTGPLPPPPPSDRNQRLFTLQAGAFLDKRDADRLSAELQERGYIVKVLKTVDAGQREWFRVRLGHYTILEQATAAARAFQEKEHIPVEVVRQPAGPPPK